MDGREAISTTIRGGGAVLDASQGLQQFRISMKLLSWSLLAGEDIMTLHSTVIVRSATYTVRSIGSDFWTARLAIDRTKVHGGKLKHH